MDLKNLACTLMLLATLTGTSACKEKPSNQSAGTGGSGSATQTAGGGADPATQPAAPLRDPQLLELGQGYGAVNFGMTPEQLTAALGEPKFKNPHGITEGWRYPTLGIEVLLTKGKVRGVACGGLAGHNDAMVQAFTGKTPEGIGMGSSEDDVVKAYGQPESSRDLPATSRQLTYRKPYATFTLIAGKVTGIETTR